MGKRNGKARIEFGDFQTPIELAAQCCGIVRNQFGSVDTVVEPTCGEGTFVAAASSVLRPRLVLAYDIDPSHIETARKRVPSQARKKCQFQRRDFFTLDWNAERAKWHGRVLFLGNPPWVTNSRLGVLESNNLPRKRNIEGLRGIDAMMGRSNFDIAESVLRTLLDAMRPDQDVLAMLVKNATARKVLQQEWGRGTQFSHASVRAIDARQSFGVSVDACWLMLQPSHAGGRAAQVCVRSRALDQPADDVAFGWAGGRLVSSPTKAEATQHLQGDASTPWRSGVQWRSGVKHDVARLLELTARGKALLTRDGDRVDVELDRVYPLAKGSDVANQRTSCLHRRLLVPQRRMNECTDAMSATLPKTFQYLRRCGPAFDARKSSIYRKRDRFAVFGIGDYTFAPWKVAICGLYKRLTFAIYGPVDGRPVVFDDTTYSLSFESESQARLAGQLLQSDLAGQFFEARIFWDAKRPITAALLRSIDLARVAEQLGRGDEYRRMFPNP